MDDSSASCASDDSLFSRFIYSHTSPISSTDVPGEDSGETTVAKEGSDSRSPSEGVDDDSTFDTLFDQYVRSPSPSPRPSPNDASSELSGATLINAEPDQPRGSAEPDAEPLKSPEDMPETEVARDQEDTCRWDFLFT